MSGTFDPYYKWLAIPPEDQPANHYRLLGVKLFESDADVIANAADARMAQVRTFQNGEHSARSQQLLNELATARVCLLNPAKKLDYDRKLEAARLVAAPPRTLPSGAPPVSAPPMPVVQMPVVTPAPALPDPMNFAFAQKKPAPPIRKETNHGSPLVRTLAIGFLLAFGGMAARVWLFSGREKPAHGSPALAQSATANQPPENEESPLQQPAKSGTSRVTDKAAAVSEPAPKIIPADATTADSHLTAPAVPGQPVAVPTRPDNDAAQSPAGMPKKESPPDANASRPDAASDKPEVASATEDRRPVPTAAERKAALEAIVEVYKEDYAKAKKPSEKIALAEKLLKQANEETNPVQQFALLGEARNFALAGSAPQLLAEIAHQLEAVFAIDEPKLLADSLDKLAEKAPAKPVLAEMAEVALNGSDGAAASDQFEQATRLANLALNAAKKSGHPELARGISARLLELADLEKLYQASQEAKAKLAANPDDAEAHLTVGKYLCFGKDDWDAGNPHLIKGNDAALQQLAQQESQPPEDASDQVKLADGWWDLAETSKGLLKLGCQHRAAWWYEQAKEKLTGLTRNRVDKRLQSLADKPASTGKSPAKKATQTASRGPGRKRLPKSLYLAELEPSSFSVLMDGGLAGKAPHEANAGAVVGGTQVMLGLRAHPPAPEAPSRISYDIQQHYRLLSGFAGIADGWTAATPLTFRIVGDGKDLWKSDPMQQGGKAVKFQVTVTGVSNLELFVDCPGSHWSASAVWIDPILSK